MSALLRREEAPCAHRPSRSPRASALERPARSVSARIAARVEENRRAAAGGSRSSKYAWQLIIEYVELGCSSIARCRKLMPNVHLFMKNHIKNINVFNDLLTALHR